MNEIDELRESAMNEWETTGVLSVSTYMELNLAGIDADAFIAEMEG